MGGPGRNLKTTRQKRTKILSNERLKSMTGSLVGPVSKFLRDAVRNKTLREDPVQIVAASALDRLRAELDRHRPVDLPPPPKPDGPTEWRGPKFDAYGQPIAGGAAYVGVASPSSSTNDGGILSRVSSFLGLGTNSVRADTNEDTLKKKLAPRGVYLVGGVGCGKTLLMDVFYSHCGIAEPAKRRLHFNEFMLDIHGRMHSLRRDHPELGDPLPTLSHDIASTTRLLCFDEFQVTDVADALVMRRLFRRLFNLGLVMVATSNRVPEELYLNGIQRQLFLPFIDDLREKCECVELGSSVDYRMLGSVSRGARTYMYPLGDSTNVALDEFFANLSSGGVMVRQTLSLRGRELLVERASLKGQVARFTFDELCGRPLGAEDYLGIAEAYRTVFLENVPQLTFKDVNQVRRLITLVDALYDKKVRLVMSSAVAMQKLYVPYGDGSESGERQGLSNPRGDLLGTATYVPDASDESFAFKRTMSRLVEMSSQEYLVSAVTARSRDCGEDTKLLNLFESDSVLSSQELLTLFRRFDVDGTGALEVAEVRLLLADLSERVRGHRNIPDEEVDYAMSIMDADKNGEVTELEFMEYFEGTSHGFLRILKYGEKEQARTGLNSSRDILE